MTESGWQSLIKNKNVVYITVKNKDYIRTRQIERILQENAATCRVYTSEANGVLGRALNIRRQVKDISFTGVDVVIVGFLPQLVWGKIYDRIIDDMAQDISITDSRNVADDIGLAKNNLSEITVIAEMFLSFYDTVVLDRKLVWKNGILANICKSLDKQVVSEADLIITDTKADADYFADEFEGDRDKFEVLYLEAESNQHGISSESVHTLKDITDANLCCGKRVLYFGTGLPLQGTDVVVDAFKILARDHGCQCVYIGGIKEMRKENKSFLLSDDCRSVAASTDDNSCKQGKEHKGSVIYHEWLSEDVLWKQISEADICLAGHFNPEIDKADRTIPGKAFMYEAAGKTMILGDTIANHEVFTPDSKHIFVPRGDSKAIVDTIIQLYG